VLILVLCLAAVSDAEALAAYTKAVKELKARQRKRR
jgi:hypothetical protein